MVSTTCEAVKLLFDCPELSDTRVWNVQPPFLNFKNFLLDTAGINRARIMSDFSIEPESPGPARVSNSLRNSREMPRDALGLGGYPTVRFQPPIRHPSSPPSARRNKNADFPRPRPHPRRPAQSESTEFDTVLETGGSEPPITDPEYTETEPETEAELPSPPRSPVRKSVEFATDAPMPSASSPLRPKSRDATPVHSPILRSTRADEEDAFEDGPFSPQQAAAAVAAAAAAAASEVARRSIDGFGEVRATSELIPPNTPIPTMPGLDDSDASDGDMTAEPPQPIPKPEVGETETHFLNKNELNQPDVMSSIAGIPAGQSRPSKDVQFEQALERVRASRREIAEQAAKGFEDMRAYYEKELQQERSRSASVSASMERSTMMPPPPPRDPAAVVAAAAADDADALLAGRSAKNGGVAWQLDEEALRASYPSANVRAGGPRSPEKVWPDAWRGSYSPPKDVVAPPPFPLPRAWSGPPEDRAPENPPDVSYPHEAAAAAAALAAAVAAQNREEIELERARRATRAAADHYASLRSSVEFVAPSAGRAAMEARTPTSATKAAKAADPPEMTNKATTPVSATKPPGGSPAATGSPPRENFDHVTDVGALREKIRRLQADLSACERREQTAERGITHAESKTREVQEKLREVTAKLQARDSEVRELGQAGQTLKDAGAEAKAEATDAKRELGAAKSIITRMTSEMTEKSHRLAALERSVQDLNAQMDATKREKIALASKLTRSEDENGRLREKVNAAAEREKEAARTAERLVREGDAARRETQILRLNNHKGSQEAADLSASLQAAREEIAELKRRCKHLEHAALHVATDTAAGRSYGASPPQHREQRPPMRAISENASSLDDPQHKPVLQKSWAQPSADVVELPPAGRSTRDIAESKAPARSLWDHDTHDQRTTTTTTTTTAPPTPPPGPPPPARVVNESHLGPGLVPDPAHSLREEFKAEYGDEHLTRDSTSHFGPGMSLVSEREMREREAHQQRMAATRARAEAAEREEIAAREAEEIRRAAMAAADRTNAELAAERAKVRAQLEAEMDRERTAAEAIERAEREAVEARRTRPKTAPPARRAEHAALETAADRYSAAEASRRGRDGSGWYGGVLDGNGQTLPKPKPRDEGEIPPWMPVTTTDGTGKRDPNATAGRPAGDSQPFATSESLESWSSHVAAVEARLMRLSVERDELEGELGRLPEGAGRTIDERRRKQHAEHRLEELNRSMSQARNQLKQAQRVHLVGA